MCSGRCALGVWGRLPALQNLSYTAHVGLYSQSNSSHNVGRRRLDLNRGPSSFAVQKEVNIDAGPCFCAHRSWFPLCLRAGCRRPISPFLLDQNPNSVARLESIPPPRDRRVEDLICSWMGVGEQITTAMVGTPQRSCVGSGRGNATKRFVGPTPRWTASYANREATAAKGLCVHLKECCPLLKLSRSR